MSVLQDIGLKVQEIVDWSNNCALYLEGVSKNIHTEAGNLDHLLGGYANADDIISALEIASAYLKTAAWSLQEAAGSGSDWIEEQVGPTKGKTLSR